MDLVSAVEPDGQAMSQFAGLSFWLHEHLTRAERAGICGILEPGFWQNHPGEVDTLLLAQAPV